MAASSPQAQGPALRAVLVGLGASRGARRGGDWLAALTSPEAEAAGVALIGVCHDDPGRALGALARAGRAAAARPARLDEALALGPDLVVDAGGPSTRLAVVRAALLAGAHVLCEPPLGPDEDTARALGAAAGRARGRLAVAHRTRVHRGARQLRDLAAGGRLGRPLTLRAELRADRRGPGPAMAHPVLRGPALHALDAARAILGVDALEARCLERGPGGQDGAEVHAQFAMADGSLFVLAANLREAGPPMPDAGAWRLVLEDGTAHWTGAGAARAWASAQGAGPSRPVPLPPSAGPVRAEGPLGCLVDLADALRHGRRPASGPRDAAASLAMSLAAIRSARAGGRPEPVRPPGLTDDGSMLPSRGGPDSAAAPLTREAP